MPKRVVMTGLIVAALTSVTVPAIAQEAREAQLLGFHQLCNQGDRKACVRFGMMLPQNSDKHAMWRQSHPEFFFFER